MGQGIRESVALITDGRFSGGTGSLYRSHFTQKKRGGPLFWLNRRSLRYSQQMLLELLVSAELAERRHLWQLVCSQTPTIF